MKNIFDNCLVRENYIYNLEDASLSKMTGILNLTVKSNFVIGYEDIEQAIKKIDGKIPGVKTVQIDVVYENMVDSICEIAKGFLSNILLFFEEEIYMAKILSTGTVTCNENDVIIHVIGDKNAKRLDENLSKKLSNKFLNIFGLNCNFKIICDEKGSNEAIQKINRTTEAPIFARNMEENIAVKANNKGTDKYKKESFNNSKSNKYGRNKNILKNDISGDILPMLEFSETSGECLVKGEIFGVTVKDIGNEKVIVTILLSDGNTSICAKSFLKNEQWSELKTVVSEGNYVKIKGRGEFDSFSNSPVLKIQNIASSEKIQRADNAENKRVELHAHTKMSSLDGLSDVKAFINQAKAWGHKAVAITDHGVVQAFPDAARAAKDDIKIIYGMEGYLLDDSDLILEDGSIDYKNRNKKTNHIIILAKNQKGLKNLYKLVSISHINYFYKKPRIPKSILQKNREGLILGSACEAGEIFRGVLNKLPEEKMKELVEFYDYLEIQPLINNQFLVDKNFVESKDDLIDLNMQIIELGKKYGKPVVATCDSHYIKAEDAVYRKVIMASQGYKDLGAGGLYFRTTEEMFKEFDYLPRELAEEIIVENPNKIADMTEKLSPVPKGKFPPHIENSENILRDECYKKAYEIYGNPLPDKIEKRLKDELAAIIDEGYAVMYVSAQMLVKKSMEDGYLVGSRGSVGSSFAATMAGITEVNPLPPHYICPKCKNLHWGDEKIYDCGVDMPEKKCEKCGTTFKQEGFTIPFETFLGIPGKIKEPDIDLNFAGEYQGKAHKYVDEIFGAKNVFKAGTIGTIATKTAFGFVKNYSEERDIDINKYEIERLAKGCEGVKRTTGQHPGGIIILPKGHEIYEFCPVQRPANDMSSNFITTHFDYHAIDENLLKLDILGHDAPSILRHLQDMTGIDPIEEVPLKDDKVNSIFLGIDALDIKIDDYRFVHGSYGIPEFGTKFVRGMLDDTKPEKFADLIRISGFSHGTDVWLGNARDYIKNGTATMQNAISTRDDIMNYLILKGVPAIEAFTIMEKVRKGKGVTDEEAELMMKHETPQWYVDSCRKIKYMFPRAHAVAYVTMAYRIAWFKVYYPWAFYAAHLTTKIDDFNWNVIKDGIKSILARIDELIAKGKNVTTKEEGEMLVLEICYEMLARGYEFKPPTFEDSQALKFSIDGKRVVVPIRALNGVGENCANMVVEEYKKMPFQTIEEVQLRGKVNKSAIEVFRENGLLQGLPESNQMTLF